MAKHSVTLKQMPELQVLHKDMVVEIKSDGRVLGKATLSKGGLGWKSKWMHVERHLSWEKLDKVIREHFGDL